MHFLTVTIAIFLGVSCALHPKALPYPLKALGYLVLWTIALGTLVAAGIALTTIVTTWIERVSLLPLLSGLLLGALSLALSRTAGRIRRPRTA